MSTNSTPPPAAPVAQESYIVSEGKKRGSTRDVRPEAAFDRYYTVLRVHAGDAILTNNWHTNEVLEHARNNFIGMPDVGEDCVTRMHTQHGVVAVESLTNNWHTNEVLEHARNNFEGYTFAM